MFFMYSKINADLIRERPSIEYDINSIQENESDPLNAYVLYQADSPFVWVDFEDLD